MTYRLNPPGLNTRWAAAHNEPRNITFPPSYRKVQNSAAQRTADSFTHVQKCHLLERKAIALGEEKKDPEQAQAAVPILPVLSPSEQNGSFAIIAAKIQWDQV